MSLSIVSKPLVSKIKRKLNQDEELKTFLKLQPKLEPMATQLEMSELVSNADYLKRQ
jgi:hypothetical protein